MPFAELFPWRGIARKIYDGSQAHAPTLHGALVDAAYAERYPEIVVAYLRAALEADRLIAAEPEKYSELIAQVTGVDAEVVYLFPWAVGGADSRFHLETAISAGRGDVDRDLEAVEKRRMPVSMSISSLPIATAASPLPKRVSITTRPCATRPSCR